MARLDFYDREDRPWPNARLSQAAIVGHTTETSSRIWIRCPDGGNCWLALSTQPIPTTGLPTVENPGAANQLMKVLSNGGETVVATQWLKMASFDDDSDRSWVFDVPGLAPDTRYYYAVFKDGATDENTAWVVGRDEPHTFRTKKQGVRECTFGLYTCHMPYDGLDLVNMQMWETFRQVLGDVGADFIIGGGDQVYADGNPKVSIWSWLKKNKDEIAALSSAERRKIMVSWYRDIYRGYWGPLSLRRVFRSYPTYMIWDDHEIMDGWGSYTKAELSDTLDSIWEWENQGKNLALAEDMFAAATRVYDEYQHCHNPRTPDNCRDYAFEWGGGAFYILDNRGHRDFTREKNKILGAAQMKRFQDWMDGPSVAVADTIFIVSPVPVVHASQFIVNHLDINAFGLADDLRDEWEHEANWEERDIMLDKVFAFSKETGKRVVFLSGDVHIGAAFRLSRKDHGDARIYQLTSSAITYYLSDFKRDVLELIVRENGTLTAHDKKPINQRTNFTLLHHVFKFNNFAVMRMRNDSGGMAVSWDMYGLNDEGDIVKTERLSL